MPKKTLQDTLFQDVVLNIIIPCLPTSQIGLRELRYLDKTVGACPADWLAGLTSTPDFLVPVEDYLADVSLDKAQLLATEHLATLLSRIGSHQEASRVSKQMK